MKAEDCKHVLACASPREPARACASARRCGATASWSRIGRAYPEEGCEQRITRPPPPIELVRLNGRVNDADGVTNVGDSMPTWAPSTKPGVFWLAFSSLRAYASLRPADAKLDQIWIAAIDANKPDPGYSAFWAPFQSMPEGNHRAFWTHVAGEKQCRCVEICGDGIDNNCNGVADEPGFQTCQAQEICGNGKDDNCDCVVDNCSQAEICNDGIDNDGDGNIDGADPACLH